MPAPISPMSSFSVALDRTTTRLFKPFKLRLWLLLAVPAWLTTLGMGAGGVPTFLLDQKKLERALENPPSLESINTFLQTHLTSILLTMAAIATVAFFIYWLYMWLNARGQFILLDHITHPETPHTPRWQTFRHPGNRLCNFFIKWDLFWLNIFLAIFFVSLFFLSIDAFTYLHALQTSPDGSATYKITPFTWAIPLWFAVSLIPVLITYFIARSTLFYLAIPLMYAKNMQPWPAFKHALTHILFPHFTKCLALFLLTLLVGLIKNTLMSLAAILSCCTLYFLSQIPVLGNLATFPLVLAALPAFLFLRILSLDFLTQCHPSLIHSLPWPAATPPEIPTP